MCVSLATLAFVIVACGPDAQTSPVGIDLLTEDQPAQACMLALATGRLVADPRSALGIAAADGSRYSVMWPFGYSAVYADDLIWLLDRAGTPIAAEGDMIEMGGGFGTNLFYACAGSIKRV
jgi:hypothetical protein